MFAGLADLQRLELFLESAIAGQKAAPRRRTPQKAQKEFRVVIGKGKSVVLVTCGSLKEARKIAAGVVKAHLAACVNIGTAPVESVYRWKGKVETTREYLLVIKTTAARLGALETEVKRLHSYVVPEFVVFEIAGGSKEYLQWLENCVC